MTEDISELEKLKRAALLVEEVTDGRIAFRADNDKWPWHIAQPKSICFHLSFNQMPQDYQPDRGLYAFNVMVYVLRWVYADASLLRKLATESLDLYRVLTAVEQQRYDPSQEDIAAFREFLITRQEQAATEQSDPIMEQTF